MTCVGNISRRTALAGAAAGTLIPVAGVAQAATTANATDAAWAEYQAASAAYEAELARYHAFEDTIREKVGSQPIPFLDSDPVEWRVRHDAWREARAHHPENPYLVDDNPFGKRLNDALAAMLAAPVATVVDIERKLTLIHELSDESMIEAEWVEPILAGVRAMLGRAAA